MYLWACSGPGAGELIAENTSYAQNLACTVGVLAALSIIEYLITRRLKAIPIVCLLLLALHPAWTIGGRIGDCGSLMVGAAGIVTLICALGVAFQSVATVAMIQGRLSRKRSSDYRDHLDENDQPRGE